MSDIVNGAWRYYSHVCYFSSPGNEFDLLEYDSDSELQEMINLYDYRYILLTINCAVNLNPFNTTVRSKTIVMLVCKNSSYEEFDPSYYKNTVLNDYNISSNTESLMMLFGSETVSKNMVWSRTDLINLSGI